MRYNFDQTIKDVIAEIFFKRSEIRVKLPDQPDDPDCILLIDDITKAIELCPENSQYLTVRSEIYLAIFMPDLALEDIEKAAAKGPDEVPYKEMTFAELIEVGQIEVVKVTGSTYLLVIILLFMSA